jgi:cobalt-zinc-cadmium efflux system outer membrane protein
LPDGHPPAHFRRPVDALEQPSRGNDTQRKHNGTRFTQRFRRSRVGSTAGRLIVSRPDSPTHANDARWAIPLARIITLIAALSGSAPSAYGQASALTLEAAREAARRVSPDLRAAREAVAAARARERQAGAFPNPVLAYSREQTSSGGQSNSQNIAVLEQPLEIGGQRAARRDAARLRAEAMEARLAAAQIQLDYEVTRAYALGVATERRAELAQQAAAAFGQARTVSERRLAAGDVSGYANRRVRLEAARYAALRADALLARRAARLALASLVVTSADSIPIMTISLVDSLPVEALAYAPDSLRLLALRTRAELRAAELEAAAAGAEARLAVRERVPVPVVFAGIKNEQMAGSSGSLNGLAAGVSLPLPLWDRRRGAVEAAEAESRRRIAEAEAARRRVAREVAEAYDAWRAAEEQRAALAPQLGPESRAALRAAQVAYTEGEISLVEWLDAVRAYQEAESTFATLQAEVLTRRAALERAVGVRLSARN